MCGCLSCGPLQGPGLQPRHVPSLGIKPATLWFIARAQSTELHQPGFVVVFLTPGKKSLILPNLLLSFEGNTNINIMFLIC